MKRLISLSTVTQDFKQGNMQLTYIKKMHSWSYYICALKECIRKI